MSSDVQIDMVAERGTTDFLHDLGERRTDLRVWEGTCGVVELLKEDLVIEAGVGLGEAGQPSATIRVVKGKVDGPFLELDRVGAFEHEDDEVVVRIPEGTAERRSVGG